MHTRPLVSLLLAAGLLLGLVVGPVATPTLAAGVAVSSDNPGDPARDLWPDLAAAPSGRLTAAWVFDRDASDIKRQVRVATSTNGGAAWSAEAVVFDGGSGVYLESPRIVYDPAGNAHLVFMYGLAANRTIHYRYLPAGAEPVPAGNWQAGQVACTNCLTPDLAVGPDGSVYVLYESPSGYLGIRRTSGVSGAWGPERRIATGQRLKGSLAVSPDNRLHVACYDVDRDRVLYARYTAYDSFAQEALVDLGASGEEPDIAAGAGNRVHIVWEQQDGVRYREVVNNVLGDQAELAGQAAGRRDVAVRADATGKVYVAWSRDLEDAPLASIVERQRVNGTWQRGTRLAGSVDAKARYPQYGQSLDGSVNLIFVEANVVKFQGRTSSTGATPSPVPTATATPQPAASPTPTRTASPTPTRTVTTAPAPVRRPAPPPPSPAPAAPAPPPGQSDAAYFPETGHFLYGTFKAFWERNGGLAVFGFPLTEAGQEVDPATGQVTTAQYFERQRFEHHPEHAGTPYEVLLGRLGVDKALHGGLTATAPFAPLAEGGSAGDCLFLEATRHRMCHAFRAYWESHGLEFGDEGVSYREALALFGFPISEEFTDPASGLVVQYFERARFEYHPNNPEPYRVLLTRLGADLAAPAGGG